MENEYLHTFLILTLTLYWRIASRDIPSTNLAAPDCGAQLLSVLSVRRLLFLLDHHISFTMFDRRRQALLQPPFFFFCNSQMFFCVICLFIKLHQSIILCPVCFFAHLNIFLLLAGLKYAFFFATLPRRPASRRCIFTLDFETGV